MNPNNDAQQPTPVTPQPPQQPQPIAQPAQAQTVAPQNVGQPTPPAIQSNPQQSIPQFVKATPVVKYPSRYALLNAQPAMLTWSKDNVITLEVVGATQPDFQCSPNDIKKFFYMTDHTRIALKDGRKFMISFNKDYLKTSVAGLGAAAAGDVLGTKLGPVPQLAGGVGLFMATYKNYKDEAKNDSEWWVTTLAQYGVKASRYSLMKVYGLTILGLVAAFIVAVIIAAIVQSI